MPKITLRAKSQRDYAHQSIDAAPVNAVVSILKPSRTNDQNAKMWAMLQDVMRASPGGRQWTKETWKCAFMQSLGHQVQFAQALDPNEGPFPVGFRSSNLSVSQMSDLIECIYEFGSRHDVEWRETEKSGYNPIEDKN